jgi:hypothetical protein
MDSPETMRPDPGDEGGTGTDEGMEAPDPMEPEPGDMGEPAADDGMA